MISVFAVAFLVFFIVSGSIIAWGLFMMMAAGYILTKEDLYVV